MPVDQINLTATARASLTTQQSLAASTAKHSQNLSTGKKVSRVTDDAVAFYAARALTERSSDLGAVKDSVGQGISTINAAQVGADSVKTLVGQLKGLATAALSTTDATERASLASQYNQTLGQVDSLVQDASYGGINLLSSSSSSLTVSLGKSSGDSLTVSPQDLGSSSLGLSAVAADGSDFSTGTLAALDSAAQTVNSAQANLGANVSALTIRAEAAQSQANIATEGAAKLTEANLNEEGASLLAAQTRSQLARVGQSVSQQQQSALLTLFK
ncbi:MAG: hypothetical protein HYU59_01290 [Magnetospirillum gryphiswaldense]|nr:hypothetical protein [Magnetospirillum gryphiswaldense]